MKTKEKIEYVPMYAATESLIELQKRLSMLFNLLPDVIEYIKETESKNQPLKEFMVKQLTQKYNDAIEVYRSGYQKKKA